MSPSPTYTPPKLASMPGIDFDALYRGESPGEGLPPITTPPWDTKAPKDNVIGWHTGGWVHGDVLDIGCGLGDNAIYLARNGYQVTGLDISPTALTTAKRRASDAGVDVKFAVGDATKLTGYTGAFDTVIRLRDVPLPRRRRQAQLRRLGAPGHPTGRHPATQLLLQRHAAR